MAYSSKNPKFNTEILTDQTSSSVSSPPSGSHRLINRNGKLLMKSSAGVETLVGASSGKNYVANPDDAYSGWTASSANVTLATNTTSGNIPDNVSKTTSISITRVTGTTDYVYYRFTLDQADYNKMLQILWDQVYSGTAGDYQVQIWSNTASNYGGTYTQITTPTTNIPAITGSFNTTFVSPGSGNQYLELRIVAAANTTALYLGNVTVTPGTLIQGAAISDWTSYTPTLAGMTLNASSLWYRQVGGDIEVQGFIDISATAASTAKISLPSGYVINTSYLPASQKNSVGYALKSTSAGGANLYGAGALSVIVNPSDTANVNLAYLNTADSSGTVTTAGVLGNDPFNATSQFTIYFKVPVTVSGAVNMGQGAQVQVYSSSTGTWDAAAAAGNTVAGLSTISGALTSDRAKVVRLPYAPQSMSDVKVVFMPTNYTAPVGQETWAPYVATASFNFGARVTALSGTDVTVTFYQHKVQGSTFNSATGAIDWASTDGQWGVVVANPSSPVGFGLAGLDGSSGLYKPGSAPGVATNVAAATGYVGETLTSSRLRSAAFGATTGVASNVCTAITLTAGDWDVWGAIGWTFGASTTVTVKVAAISATDGTLPGTDTYGVASSSGEMTAQEANASYTPVSDAVMTIPTSTVRVANGATLTLYLVQKITFGTSTASFYGSITARRVR